MRLRIGTALLGLMLITAACGGEATPSGSGDGGDGGGDGTLTFWTVEDNVDRVEGQQAIIDRFTEDTGIEVELVAIGEGDLTTQITSAVPVARSRMCLAPFPSASHIRSRPTGWSTSTPTPRSSMRSDADTFSSSALDLVTTDDGLAGVPSDSWAQLLVYRKDLFEAAGLEPPTTFDTILAAAEELNTGDQAGIVLATGNDLAFVQQTFEYFAVANGCDVVDADGNVTLTSPQCVETFDFYTNLVEQRIGRAAHRTPIRPARPTSRARRR